MPISIKPREIDWWGISTDRISHPHGRSDYWLPRESLALPLWPDFATFAAYAPGDYVRHRKYGNYAFEMPLTGQLRLKQRDQEVVLEPGDLGIIHRGEDSYLVNDGEVLCRKFGFGMRGTALGGIVAAAGLSEKLSVKLRNPEELFKKLLRLQALIHSKRQADIPTISGLGMEILTEIAIPGAASRDERLDQALNLFAIGVTGRLTVAEAAEALHISPTTLGRLFRRELGVTPQAYLRDLKMQSAVKLLCETSLSIKAIAARLGFTDAFAFSHEFKKATGLSPREYRNQPSNPAQ